MNDIKEKYASMNKNEKSIYVAAKELFFKKGYYNTSTREIAEAAGVNSGLISYYFNSKSNLAVRIFDEMFFNIKTLTTENVPLEKNPAVLMGLMMKLQTYALQNEKIIKFVEDTFTEGIFEESILNSYMDLMRKINIYYDSGYSDEKLLNSLTYTVGVEKSLLTKNRDCNICYTTDDLSSTILRMHLFSFRLEDEEVEMCLRLVHIHFEKIRKNIRSLMDKII